MTGRKRVDEFRVRDMRVEVWDVTIQMGWKNTGYELVDAETRITLGYVYSSKAGFRASTDSTKCFGTLQEAVQAQVSRSTHGCGWKDMV